MIVNLCKKCLQKKVLTDFPKDKSAIIGYRSICFPCHREHRKLSESSVRKEKIKATLDRYKIDKGCKDCGITYYGEPWLLEFDHLFDKKYKVSAMLLKQPQEIKEELKKCDVVCLVCHKRRTARRAGYSIAHLNKFTCDEF